ncbi:hypothetical protein RB653_003197 [Dictyostelium firmibasis]|uniref:Coactosin n=1 Tax=Dictyostelium firmibasis TaxID=79012 RepID=A0AAN7TRS0_9MYCE
MSLQFVDDSACKSAVADLKKDSNPTDWVLLSFESPKSQKIKLAGFGNGGVAELVEYLQDDMVGFALVRKIDRIDDSETVKFAFINFIGEKVGILQKGKISVTIGSVKDFFGAFQCDFLITSKNEISDDIVLNKIQDISGTGSKVLDENGAKTGASKSTTSPTNSFRRSTYGSVSSPSSSSTSKDAIKLGDEPTIREALKEFRSDENDIDWVLFGYEGGNSNTIILLGKGNGGVNELISNLNDNLVAYGLVRIVEKIDNSDTIKFAYINWIGEDIPRMLRARLGTHTGFVNQLVTPYHVDIKCTVKSEISKEIVEETVAKASGKASMVLSGDVQSHGGRMTSSYSSSSASTQGSNTTGRSFSGAGSKFTTPSAVPKSSGSTIGFDNEQQVKDTIKDVRSDSTDTNWCLIGYKNDTTLQVIAKGSGGADELVGHLNSKIVAYGLVREVERFDLSDTIKFAFIDFVGEDINRMFRAKLGTHSGTVKQLFHPYHVDLHVSSPSELSSEIVTKTITQNSGTSSRVKA